MMKAYLKFVFLASLISAVLGLTGCQNTVEGFGKDMQQNGQKIQQNS